MLLPIKALAFYIAFIPQHNSAYTVHIDEWVHLACTKMLMSTGSRENYQAFVWVRENRAATRAKTT